MKDARSTRVRFRATASLHFDNAHFTNCETADLSTKGLFVFGAAGRKAGDECSIELRLSGTSTELMLGMRGKVVRAQGDGVALNFFEIDLDSYYHLKNIVYYNSENPDALTGEFDPAYAFEGKNELQDTFE